MLDIAATIKGLNDCGVMFIVAVHSHFIINLSAFMEVEGLLDIGSDVQMYAMPEVFQPRINAYLKEFPEGWN